MELVFYVFGSMEKNDMKIRKLKLNIMLVDFIWICDLDKMKGYDLGRIYRNINFVEVFI